MTYDFNGTQYSQGRLSVASLLRLARFFKSRAAGDGAPGMDLDGILALAEDSAVWGEFLGIIFRQPGPIECDTETLDADLALDVVTDFLSCNAGIVPKLTALLSGTVSAVTKGKPAR